MTEQIGRFIVSMGAIIEHKQTGKLLILKRSVIKDFSAGIWEYVTGRLHQFEEPLDGLRREISEESGLEVEIIKPINTFHVFRGEKTAEKEVVGIMYWCRTDSQDVVVSEEHSEFKWVTPEEALEIIEKPSMQDDIRAFMHEKKINA
jgi:8-oxo-dGTP diphosphatase